MIGWRFTSHDVISARKIFYLLNIFLAQKYLILNFPYILRDYVIYNSDIILHRSIFDLHEHFYGPRILDLWVNIPRDLLLIISFQPDKYLTY